MLSVRKMNSPPASASSSASARSLLAVAVALVLLILCLAGEASAKRGCSAFGHSCFGGHGKRSEALNRVENSIREEVDGHESQESQDYETPGVNGEIIVADDAAEIYHDRSMPRFQPIQLMTPQQQHPRYNLSPFIRQWLASYRRGNSIELQNE